MRIPQEHARQVRPKDAESSPAPRRRAVRSLTGASARLTRCASCGGPADVASERRQASNTEARR
jgi:hypothetical protein